MKCPFRKYIKHCKDRTAGMYGYKYDETTEEYENCYEEECPYYNYIATNTGITARSCGRVRKESVQ